MMDREANSSYSLTAVLSDGSEEMDIILNIRVDDMNDNSPSVFCWNGRLS